MDFPRPLIFWNDKPSQFFILHVGDHGVILPLITARHTVHIVPSPALQECFIKDKERIVEAVKGVQHFAKRRPTCLACDLSKADVG